MKHDIDLHAADDEEPLEEAFTRTRISFAARTGVEHRIVSIWLRTWGKPDFRPFREWLAAPNG